MKKTDWLAISCVYFACFVQLPVGAETAQPLQSDAPTKKILPSPPLGQLRQQDAVEDSDVSEAQMAQLTPVSDLSDVQPGDWAYQSLQSLIQRYGILTGYPDGTFRGNRPLTRGEFAAAIEQVLAVIEREIATGKAGTRLRQDLATLQQLQTALSAAIPPLQQRLDRLTNLTTILESQQVSTTTKLQGQAILAFTGGQDANNTTVAQVRLNLLSSFTDQDLLLMQLELGNDGRDAIAFAHRRKQNLLGTLGVLADGGGLEYIEADHQPRLRRLAYSFRPLPELSVTVGSKIAPSDFIDRNRFANNPSIDFSSSFLINNPLIVQNQIDREGGAGVAATWQFSQLPLTVRALYIAADAEQVNPTNAGGLFGDRNQSSLELEYLLSEAIALRLQYTHAQINNTVINAAGINAEWSLARHFGLFSRFGFGRYEGFNTALRQDLDLSPTSWAVGLVVRDFFIPGTVAGIALGQPFIADIGNATQTNFEMFYNLAINESLTLTPDFMLVIHPDNNRDHATIWQGTIRTVFKF